MYGTLSTGQSKISSWGPIKFRQPLRVHFSTVLYVGNLSPQTTTERLEKFISERMKSVGAETPRIFNSRMHANRKDENGSVIGARITVPTDAVPTLTSRSFLAPSGLCSTLEFHTPRQTCEPVRNRLQAWSSFKPHRPERERRCIRASRPGGQLWYAEHARTG